MKIDNEFIDGEKRFIRNIKKCICTEKIGDYYILKCKIIQHGEYEYVYEPGTGHISKHTCKNKKLWLTDSSKAQADAAVHEMNAVIEKAQSNGYAYEDSSNIKLAIYYERKSDFMYECLIRRNEKNNISHYNLYSSLPIEKIVQDVGWQDRDGREVWEADRNSIESNPFYIAAIHNHDELLQKQLKLYYRIADEKECIGLSETLGRQILPSLSEAFDKTYCVDRDTISKELIFDYGYQI